MILHQKVVLCYGTLPLGFVFQKQFADADADFSCKGQTTNLPGPLDHPSEPNIHPCKLDKNNIFQFLSKSYFMQFIPRSHIF
jgi:hypothetical protein